MTNENIETRMFLLTNISNFYCPYRDEKILGGLGSSVSMVAVNFLEHSVGFSGTFLPVEGEQQNFPQMGTFWLGNHHFPRAPEIFHDLNFSKTPRMLMPHHSISTRTISRRLVANGLHSCRPLRRLPLTPPNRRQRLEWCRGRSTWMTEWHRVVFSDQSRFCLSSDSRRVRVWRRRGERSNPAAIVERPTVRQRGIMVWGAIAYDSRSPLLRIQGTMTAQRYVDDVLRPVTLPYLQGVPNALYQQDNARPHTARISQQALQDVQMLPWPPYSPDLSSIRHVWDIIGRRLHALPQPRSEDELWQMAVCIACGSSDLAHRYWSCSTVRLVIREVFSIIGPAVLDVSSRSRGPCHHHLFSGEAHDLRIFRKLRNAWCRWSPAGDSTSNSAAVAEVP
ncbi:hypothetical protein LAZ67_2005362 [Cordylochernes scorpioides]|uniref:Transposase n=1 Tax=Cordylochernes scorpioides TaxID=51811 RepID=A0ABY6K4B0_9ARAC|nr:hypothetical protein LAZ67_2005362 [Cordylochernes scorpioides]